MLSEEELSRADAKFLDFLEQWAASKGKHFKIEGFDGRETLFDGMAVDDVWGWLLDNENDECRDDNFGCVEWRIQDDKLVLKWDTSEYGL